LQSAAKFVFQYAPDSNYHLTWQFDFTIVPILQKV
jgi:hypothetical protein